MVAMGLAKAVVTWAQCKCLEIYHSLDEPRPHPLRPSLPACHSPKATSPTTNSKSNSATWGTARGCHELHH